MFKFAVTKTEEIARRLLERNKLRPEDVDLLVSHQANRRIIESAARAAGPPTDKFVINIEHTATRPRARSRWPFSDARAAGRIKKDDLDPVGVGGRRVYGGLGTASLGDMKRFKGLEA